MSTHPPRRLRRLIKDVIRRMSGPYWEHVKVLRNIHRRGSPKQRWNDGIDHELQFWRSYIAGDPRRFAGYLDPNLQLQPKFRELLQATGREVSILDVGAGPKTYIGKRWDGHGIQITAVDPLALDYDRILEKYAVTVPVRTRPGHAEELKRLFAVNQFDLVYARNCLDHSYDPLRGIQEMLAVVKQECYVYLEHKTREGETEGYVGLHQWDFYEQGGDFCIASPGRFPVNVTRRLAALAETMTRVDETGWLVVTMRKR